MEETNTPEMKIVGGPGQEAAPAEEKQIRTRIEAPAAQLLLEADGPVRLQVQIQNGSILVCTR